MYKSLILIAAAFGCADIAPMPGAWIRRTGDTAVVKCNLTGATYFLTCKDSAWKGELHNCTSGNEYQNRIQAIKRRMEGIFSSVMDFLRLTDGLTILRNVS
jgi:hypothetical protein